MLSVGKLTVFNRFPEIFANKYGSFSPKIGKKKQLSKSVCGYFKTKCGDGSKKALVVGPLKKKKNAASHTSNHNPLWIDFLLLLYRELYGIFKKTQYIGLIYFIVPWENQIITH